MIADMMRELLAHAGIAINGPNPWDIQVKDDRWYVRIWQEKNLGLGESYMDGWWSCAQIDEMVCRILRGGVEEKIREFYDTIAPELQALPKGCLVTVSPVEVILHKSGTKRDKLI